jgi:hypothetical protein
VSRFSGNLRTGGIVRGQRTVLETGDTGQVSWFDVAGSYAVLRLLLLLLLPSASDDAVWRLTSRLTRLAPSVFALSVAWPLAAAAAPAIHWSGTLEGKGVNAQNRWCQDW